MSGWKKGNVVGPRLDAEQMDSTFRPALLLMSGRALGFGVTFLIPVVLVRVFDQAEFGTYKQLFLIYFTLLGIAQFGMAESLYYFLPLDSEKGGRYVANALWALSAAGLISLGLLAAFRSMISEWMNNSALSGYIPLLGVHLWLMLAATVLEIVMISRKRYLWASLSFGFWDLLRAVLFIVPVVFMRRLEWLFWGAVVLAWMRICVALFYLRREFGGEFKPDAALFRTQLAYALPFQMSVVVDLLQANLHQYAVSYHFDAATFAIYAVGCLQIPFVDFFAGPVANVMMVRMGEERKDGRGHAVVPIWNDTTRKLALVFFPMVGLLLVNADKIIVFLFTESYLPSIPIFMIWSAGILLTVLQTDSVLRVYAETRFLLLISIIRLLLIVGLIQWFLAAFHLSGGVLITVLALGVGKGLALLRMKRVMRTSLREVLPWRSLAGISVVACIAGMAALVVKSFLEVSALPMMLVTSGVYMTAYLLLLFWMSVLTDEERMVIKGWLSPLAAPCDQAVELKRD